MCGFVGFVGGEYSSQELKRSIAGEMIAKIRHRGPDEEGIYTDGYMTLGFARLKIMDLENGAQPMVSDDGRYVLCFNGEIYNFKELRSELEKGFGERFFTECDTEVLLKLLVRYGVGALKMLRGMYAFAFYDKENNRLFAARDPFGIKPLYYCTFDGCFMLASEIKAFLAHPKFVKELDTSVLPYYLQFQYVPTEHTAFKGVYRLKAGHMLVYENGRLKSERYFETPKYLRSFTEGYSFFGKGKRSHYTSDLYAVKSELNEAILDSVAHHKVSDVPMGAFLSGGVDSGLILQLARPQKAFTVGFTDHGFDERAFAIKRAAEVGSELFTVEADADDFFGALPSVQYHSDEPYANLSAVPLYLLAKKTKEQVGAVLSGEGADELFGGYEWYKEPFLYKAYRLLPRALRRSVAKAFPNGRVGQALRRLSEEPERSFIGQARIMTEAEARELLAPDIFGEGDPFLLTGQVYKRNSGASLLRKKMALDTELWLPFDILNKADKMTMAASLELRVPYLDLKVLDVAQRCSDRLLVRARTTKRILRAVAREHLGKESAMRIKKGFPVPFREWIRSKCYAALLYEEFDTETCKSFFNAELLKTMLEDHVKGRANNARRLYTVYAFLVWYGVYFGKGEKVT